MLDTDADYDTKNAYDYVVGNADADSYTNVQSDSDSQANYYTDAFTDTHDDADVVADVD